MNKMYEDHDIDKSIDKRSLFIKPYPSYRRRIVRATIISVDNGAGTMVNVFSFRLDKPSLVYGAVWLENIKPNIVGNQHIVALAQTSGANTPILKYSPNGEFEVLLEESNMNEGVFAAPVFSDFSIDNLLVEPGEYLIAVADSSEPDILLTATRAFIPATEAALVSILEKVDC